LGALYPALKRRSSTELRAFLNGSDSRRDGCATRALTVLFSG
jgi:hypothetical protein